MTASKQSQDGTGLVTAVNRCNKTCMKLTSAECTVEKLLMMGREDARNF